MRVGIGVWAYVRVEEVGGTKLDRISKTCVYSIVPASKCSTSTIGVVFVIPHMLKSLENGKIIENFYSDWCYEPIYDS